MIVNAKSYVEWKINELQNRVSKLKTIPTLAIIKVGNDLASQKYVNNKVNRCKEVGINSRVIEFGENVTSDIVEETIKNLNSNDIITGILLQLPLPKHLDEEYLTNLIIPSKDVDGFTITNTGKLSLGMDCSVACTPRGIIDLLKFHNIEIEGKDVLIINRSNIVGKPLAQLFLKENATVTIAHSKTKDLKNKIFNSDIVVSAIGKANYFNHLDFNNNTTIVDVSINFDENGKMCGDVSKSDYDLLIEKGCNITPVPNGVGQTTVISLIEQTIELAELRG